MRRSAFLLLAAVSLLVTSAPAARRPRYGGTLRIEVQQAVRSLDPAEWAAAAAETEEKLAALVFEPLLHLDAGGQPQPALALVWQSDAGGRRWQFRLRPGVKFHDGSPLTPAAAAAALATTGWQISPTEDGISIRSEQPLGLSDFADLRHSVCLRAADGTLSGTGPFRLTQFDPGHRAVFTANEDYWDGRPFLDAVAVQMGRGPHEQMLDLELGKTDFIELWPNELRRAAQAGVKTWSSAPIVLLALVFPNLPDVRLREAVALCLDRAAMHSVLLQKQGEPAASLLPQWMSGYAFLFSAARDPARARQLVAAAPANALLLGYDGFDPLARPLAERVAVNAREAGLRIVPAPQATRPDVRLVRVRIQSLPLLAAALGLGDLPAPSGPEAACAAERALLEDFRVVPLVHLPEMYGSSAALKVWHTRGVLQTGAWRLDDMWLDAGRSPASAAGGKESHP